MPTQRFYRLPIEKQMNIRDAAIMEFTRVPFEKVSINKIIQHADISRGSFYTYFEDKRDVLAFIFHNLRQSAHSYCQNIIRENGGDFWDMMEKLMGFMLDLYQNNDLMKLSKNLMMNPEIANWLEMECLPPGQDGHTELGMWLYDHIDRDQFRYQTFEYFELLIGMSMAALFVSIAQFHKKSDSVEAVKESFHSRLEIVKYGVCSNKTE